MVDFGIGTIAVAAITGFVSRLGEEGAAEIIGRFRRAYAPPVPASPQVVSRIEEKRHDLAGPGVVTSDVNLTVRYHRRAAGRTRAVVMSLHVLENLDDFVIVPMMLGETTELTVPRNNYYMVALVMSVPTVLGTPPTLHGIGTDIRQISSNRLTRVSLTTADPTVERMMGLGLMAPDGSSPLRMAGAQYQTPPAQAQVPTGYGYGNLPYSNVDNWPGSLGNGYSAPGYGSASPGYGYGNPPYSNGNNWSGSLGYGTPGYGYGSPGYGTAGIP